MSSTSGGSGMGTLPVVPVVTAEFPPPVVVPAAAVVSWLLPPLPLTLSVFTPPVGSPPELSPPGSIAPVHPDSATAHQSTQRSLRSIIYTKTQTLRLQDRSIRGCNYPVAVEFDPACSIDDF